MDKRDKIAIYERIVKKMADRGGMNNTTLAKRVNKLGYRLTPRSMSIYARGEATPGSETVVGICKVLNCTADYILFGNEPGQSIQTVGQAIAAIDAVLANANLTTAPLDVTICKAISILKGLDERTRTSVVQIIENAGKWQHPASDSKTGEAIGHQRQKGR